MLSGRKLFLISGIHYRPGPAALKPAQATYGLPGGFCLWQDHANSLASLDIISSCRTDLIILLTIYKFTAKS